MSCTHCDNCQLYAQLAMEPTLRLWKQKYCEEMYEECARFKLALEGQAVPLTLLPNGKKLERRSRDELAAAALFNAILKQRVPMVKAMLKTGMPSKRIISADGMTPLMVAASVGNLELVELMMSRGCSPFATNKNGETAYEIAGAAGATDCMEAIKKARTGKSADDYVSIGEDGKPVKEEPNEESVMNEVVSFLRKLNPFKAA
ncbi:MAG: ankyrin repeat domain-containing protein [Gammaproteobacteria bacterium]|nr:ankyrin repeat domain-containing protein [Gammaproteobacteria bacterium]